MVVWLKPVKYHHGYCPILCQLSKWSLCLSGMVQIPEINVNDKESATLRILRSPGLKVQVPVDAGKGWLTVQPGVGWRVSSQLRKSGRVKVSQRGPRLDGGKQQLPPPPRTRGSCLRRNERKDGENKRERERERERERQRGRSVGLFCLEHRCNCKLPQFSQHSNTSSSGAVIRPCYWFRAVLLITSFITWTEEIEHKPTNKGWGIWEVHECRGKHMKRERQINKV